MTNNKSINLENEYVYDIVGRSVIIRGYIGNDTKITIPEFIENKPVTKIDSEAFEGKHFVEVNMPDTIKEVGKYAFASNMHMTNIKLSSNLKAIPEGMFAFCGKLREIEIPTSVKSIGKNSFDFVKLKRMVIPSSVNKISNKMFKINLEECRRTTFIVEKGSFADEVLSSKNLDVEYIDNL